jgi:hypothetical protein
MNFPMTLPTERLKISWQFIEDANIAEMMNLSGRALLASFANSLCPAESGDSKLAPKRAAEIPLISGLSIEGFDL